MSVQSDVPRKNNKVQLKLRRKLSNRLASKVGGNKQTTLMIERVEQAAWVTTAANENIRQKEELQQKMQTKQPQTKSKMITSNSSNEEF